MRCSGCRFFNSFFNWPESRGRVLRIRSVLYVSGALPSFLCLLLLAMTAGSRLGCVRPQLSAKCFQGSSAPYFMLRPPGDAVSLSRKANGEKIIYTVLRYAWLASHLQIRISVPSLSTCHNPFLRHSIWHCGETPPHWSYLVLRPSFEDP